MLISYSNKFIGIQVYRVAGSSIRKALQKFQYPPHESYLYHVLKRLSLLPSDQNVKGHITGQELRQKLPSLFFNNFLKFCFVRNPWSWQVSMYFYAAQNKQHFQHQLIKAMSFEEYIEWRVSKDKHLQSEFFLDENDNKLVDFIGKFENLETDFKKVCEKIGVQASLPHVNKSKHKNYRKYYNKKTRNLIYNHFKKDIELLNYKF